MWIVRPDVKDFYEMWLRNWGFAKSYNVYNITVTTQPQRDFLLRLMTAARPNGKHAGEDRLTATGVLERHELYYIRWMASSNSERYRVAMGDDGKTANRSVHTKTFDEVFMEESVWATAHTQPDSSEGRVAFIGRTKQSIITTKLSFNVIEAKIDRQGKWRRSATTVRHSGKAVVLTAAAG